MEAPNSFHAAEKTFYDMIDFLQCDTSKSLHLSGLEAYLLKEGRELLRQLLLGHLAERGVGDIGARVIGSDGVERTRSRLRTTHIITMFGKIPLTRRAYSAPQTFSLFPLDAMLNLPRLNFSYVLQQYIILELIKNSFQETRDSLQRWTGITLTQQEMKDIVHDGALDFKNFYHVTCLEEKTQAQSLPLLVLTSDGKGVMMRKEDLRKNTRQKLQEKPGRKGQQKIHSKRRHRKRMATVASVYEIDRYIRTPSEFAATFFSDHRKEGRASQRPIPSAKRLWASLEDPPEVVIHEVFHEALQRDPERHKEWVVCVDGDLHQIAHFLKLSEEFEVSITIICDIMHVLEYLWKAGNVLQNAPALEGWVYEKLQAILAGKSRSVAAGLRRSATLHKLKKTEREPVDNCARYLTNHAPYLCYQTYLEKGYPIATGIIEGACRYLVKDRMEITGARWSLKGGEALLQLRAIKLSGDFLKYWEFHETMQYKKNYESFYQNPNILLGKNPL